MKRKTKQNKSKLDCNELVSVCELVCVCVYMCGCKREREREREGSICKQSPSNMENLNPYKQKNDFKLEMLNSHGRGLRECVNYFRELKRKKNIKIGKNVRNDPNIFEATKKVY